MSKAKADVTVDATENKSPEVKAETKVEETKVEADVKVAPAVASAPEVQVDKVDKVPVNNVKCKVIKDIPNLYIWGSRYANRKGETLTCPENHANKLREGGYIQ